MLSSRPNDRGAVGPRRPAALSGARARAPARPLLLAGLSAAAITLAAVGCSGGAGVGETCTGSGQCDSDLQCFQGFCSPRCQHHVDCGDGYRCRTDGTCQQVTSVVGDVCNREIDCGPGQSCALDAASAGAEEPLGGTCQQQRAGAVTGAGCTAPDDCQTGICAIGRCSQMCSKASDCPPGLTCAVIPQADLSGTRFLGCLPDSGVIAQDLTVAVPTAALAVPVPSNARSFALVSRVDPPTQQVGASRVIGPDGRLLYRTPLTESDYYDNPLRYQPALGVSTLFVPNSPSVTLEVGVYQVEVGSLLAPGRPGTAIPRVRAVYKLDTGATLDLHFYFLDLGDHPCAAAFDSGRLSAASAPTSPVFQGYVHRIEGILAQADIQLGTITYQDISDRGDLDTIDRERLGDLLALAQQQSGVSVFLVRSITPVGVEALAGATPGPPLTAGTTQSGIAVGMDTLCYRHWDDLARLTTHTLARQMGLYHNRDPDGHLDPIPDSDESSDNLMFFGEFGGTSLSSQQQDVLRRYPGLQ